MNTLPVGSYWERIEKENVGEVDAVARLVIGGGLCLAAAFGFLPAWGWIGVIPFATGFFGHCPLYALTGYRSTFTFHDMF
jgi:Protein of unknown function (DUF2892)